MTGRSLWEILVPTQTNKGKPIRTRQHREWDGRVRKISGGLTILKPARGQWVDPGSGLLYAERMIPVRLVATKTEMMKIAKMTARFYDQLVVLVYPISTEIFLVDQNGKLKS